MGIAEDMRDRRAPHTSAHHVTKKERERRKRVALIRRRAEARKYAVEGDMNAVVQQIKKEHGQ